MRTKMKYAFTFLFGVIFYWAVSTSFNPAFIEETPVVVGIVAMLITLLGSGVILFFVINFFIDAWSVG